jgi:hypothetical protein
MAEYKLCLFDGEQGDGQRAARWVSLSSDTDEEASRHANAWRKGRPAELWHAEELVKVFRTGRAPQ